MALLELKKLRLLAGLSQAQVAAKLGISQSTFQRWESGALPIPHEKRKTIAKVFGVKADELDKDSAKFDYLGIDRTVPDDKRYFGEVAIHFYGDVAPLLSPISFAERTRILTLIESGRVFFTFRSLDNWIIVVRTRSISDLYVSSDACDEYGPADQYETHLGVLPDSQLWNIVENAEAPQYIADIPEKKIKEVMAGLEFDEQFFQQAIAAGDADESDRDAIQAEISQSAPRMIRRATMLTWQFADGKVRNEYVSSDAMLADTLMAFDLLQDEDIEMIQIPVEEWHRSICINANLLNYIAFPAHRTDRGFLKQL